MTPPDPLARLVAAVDAYVLMVSGMGERGRDQGIIDEFIAARLAAAQAARPVEGALTCEDVYPGGQCPTCATAATPTDADVEADIAGWLDRIDRIDEPAYTGYDLASICRQMRAALAALRARREGHTP